MRLRLTTLVLPLIFVGCDDRPKAPPPPDTQPASRQAPATADPIDFDALAATEPTPLRPGFAVGRILGEDGKPVRMNGKRAEIKISGVAEDTSDVNLRFDVPANGGYIQAVPTGTYTTVTGRIEFPFEGNMFRLPLIPIGEPNNRQESYHGVLGDFAWKISGLRPGMTPDPAKHDAWLGGSIQASYVSYHPKERRALRPAPAGTKVTFIATPRGALADGRPGSPIAFERNYEASGAQLEQPNLNDLPLARYEIRGHELFPDGRKSPLLFQQADHTTWAESLEGTFDRDLNRDRISPVIIHFTRIDRTPEN